MAIVDGQGRRYEVSSDALKRQLVPEECYATDFTFDVPTDAQDLRLVRASRDIETPFLIGA
ncbi:MAG TPA: hypothetical protein VFU41_16200 [Gemmatimonadales bacterium]|nr:hypothetical protein [Gemmatimonadales bacterium]